MIETTDTTSQNELIPEGHYILKVAEIPEKVLTDKGSFRIWEFVASLDGKRGKPIKMLFFPWESRDLLVALGGVPDEKNPKKIIWDDENVAGRIIEADIKHGKYKNKNGEEKDKYVFENITSKNSKQKKSEEVFSDPYPEEEDEEDNE